MCTFPLHTRTERRTKQKKRSRDQTISLSRLLKCRVFFVCFSLTQSECVKYNHIERFVCVSFFFTHVQNVERNKKNVLEIQQSLSLSLSHRNMMYESLDDDFDFFSAIHLYTSKYQRSRHSNPSLRHKHQQLNLPTPTDKHNKKLPKR